MTYIIDITVSVVALLLVFGIFFAWETRGVRVEALNDSKQIGLCVYNVMIMSVICVPLVHLLSAGQVDISYGVVSICILVCVTATLALVFGLKVTHNLANALFLCQCIVAETLLLDKCLN